MENSADGASFDGLNSEVDGWFNIYRQRSRKYNAMAEIGRIKDNNTRYASTENRGCLVLSCWIQINMEAMIPEDASPAAIIEIYGVGYHDAIFQNTIEVIQSAIAVPNAVIKR